MKGQLSRVGFFEYITIKLFSTFRGSGKCVTLRMEGGELPLKSVKIFAFACQGKNNLIIQHFCGSGSVVERCLAKANVASSNLVFRSIKT